jgi:hypothetical protein
MSSYRDVKKNTRKIVNLQIFHGKIKGINYPRNAEKIMEFGAGHLNDLLNWTHKGIKSVHAIEVDEKSIKRGEEKYKKYKSRFQLPAIQYIRAHIIDDHKKIMDVLKKLKGKINHIFCNFMIHYLLKDKASVNILFDLIKFFLKIGGKFHFTTMDGQIIHHKFDQKNFLPPLKIKKDTIYFMHNNEPYFKIKKLYSYTKKLEKYGQPISVYVISIGKFHKEYLINLTYLTKKFKKNGFKINEFKKFEDYKKEIKESKKLSPAENSYSMLNVYVSYIRIR